MDVQFHSPPVLIHCLGQTSLINPSTFFAVLRIVAVFLGSSHQSVGAYCICHLNCG